MTNPNTSPTSPGPNRQPTNAEAIPQDPWELLLAQLGNLVPGEYDPEHRQETTLYIDGSPSDRLTVLNAHGRYNVIHRRGIRNPDLYWVFKETGTVLPMSASDLPSALAVGEAAPDLHSQISDMIARGTEKPLGRIRTLLAGHALK